MEDLYTRIDPETLYQPFLARVQQTYADLDGRGYRFYCTCGVRTWEEQDGLFAIGRTTGTPGHVVTKARGGFSPHNFGVAVDGCHDSDIHKLGLQPDYKNKSVYKLMADAAQAHGLEAGYYWASIPDGPHIQLPLKRYGITWAKLREVYNKGQYKGLYAYLDHFNW